ncbi:hypothetical protein [Cellulophaga baltica]|uniref:hypothetical protein n=1 Tax=Cellulophaga baltica TaxID=76594 RepID=UPI0015F4EC6C|nr:hypothetical protein [Cellulophaga baltica]MBA6316982.1 hypothetical protein [Cellulophaga baltica]
MKLDINTLIIGFIGSLIGVFLSGTYGRITKAFKLNRIRKIIINYFQAIAIPKCDKYINDVEQGIKFVKNFKNQESKEDNDWTFDYMPMFNSDILKSISPEVLLQASFKAKTHSDLIEIIYTIDFLKSNMTIDKASSFKEKVLEHLEEKDIRDNELYEHLKDCNFYDKLSKQVISDFNLKKRTAIGLNKEQRQVLKDLNGKSFMWIVKYIWRQ